MIAIDARSPETIQAQLILAAKCLDLHRPDEAIALLNRFLKINDAVPEMYNARGFAYLQKGDWNRAREDFEQVVRLSPQFPGVQEKLESIRRSWPIRPAKAAAGLRAGKSITVALSSFAPRKLRSFAERKATLVLSAIITVSLLHRLRIQ